MDPSCAQLESINNALAKATVVLREAHNERSPLLNLPIEILHKVLELVPDSCTTRWKRYHPSWRNALTDSAMLVPVTQTCRRLREVALAHPTIWTTFQAFPEKRALARQMAAWSKHVPLNAVGSDVGVMGELPPNTRFRSIHLYGIGEDCGSLRTLVEQFSSATLSSFLLFCYEKYDWDSKEGGQPLSLTLATNLRDLALNEVRALPDRGFPRLTHLALLDVSTPLFHERVVNFIRECPQLENIALHAFTFTFANADVANDPAPIPLPRLRHVTLTGFSPDALAHYLALLQPRVHGSSVQILGYHCRDHAFPTSFLLPPNPASASASASASAPAPVPHDPKIKVCIGIHPTGLGDYSVSLTTVLPHTAGTVTTRRIAAWVLQLSLSGTSPPQWPALIFSQDALAASPWAVDEMWLYAVGSASSPWKRSPLELFPGARTVVLVAEGAAYYDGPPSLRLLPFVRAPRPTSESESDPDSESESELQSDPESDPESAAGIAEPSPIATSTSITTLRLVHGFRDHDRDGFSGLIATLGPAMSSFLRSFYRGHLSLAQLIHDFRSGGYGYVKHFVLQVTPHLDVDEAELDALRDVGRFETFRFERIEEIPGMPGQSDPAHRGGERYPGALW
ncbi:hypothetical protein GSI_07841 [Ganoderma sinense ZZ0214-1]|uniref:Uncharacterized protein n=1 Tax=Ganoderma sinense ZZ0214-1 TaxID=1077348 RepID=A0A2G8S824_9APHY|nr:hypothetical protein GSI_07841 [Ganoderma sinense ZZ0214-1]